MKEEPLDPLFKNLSSTTPAHKESQWDEFEVRLHKKMFYKFSWTRFNIYYVTLICFSVLTNILLLFMLATSYTPPAPAQDTELHASDTTTVRSYVPSLNTNEGTSTTRHTSGPKTTRVQATADSVSATTDVLQEDTLRTAPDKSILTTPAVPAAVVVKRKSTMYISKRDTIIKIDTVKVKRKK